jgi:hypothetical protein
MERPIDHCRNPPAGDRVLAQLEQAGRHSGRPVEAIREGGREQRSGGLDAVGR